jgi:hypothetical protein
VPPRQLVVQEMMQTWPMQGEPEPEGSGHTLRPRGHVRDANLDIVYVSMDSPISLRRAVELRCRPIFLPHSRNGPFIFVCVMF